MFKFDNTLKKLVAINLKTGRIPMLVGEPGIGKSSWVESLARDLHTCCFTLAVNQLADKADLLGPRMIATGKTDENGEEIYMQKFFPHSVICQAVCYAKEHPHETPILFLDEINRSGSDITSAALSLPTLRSLGDTKLPDNLAIVVAGNDRGHVTSLDKASTSRFVKYPVTPDLGTYLSVNPNLNPYIEKTLRAYPDDLFGHAVAYEDEDSEEAFLSTFDDDGDKMEQICTPRTISALSDTLNQLDESDLRMMLATNATANTSVLQEMVEAHTGATLFSAHLQAQIVEDLNNSVAVAVAKPMEKPPFYDRIRKQAMSCGTLTEMSSLFENMDANTVSGMITYALFDDQNNDLILDAAAPCLSGLAPNDMRALMQMVMNGQINKANAAHLAGLNTPLSQSLQSVFGCCGSM